MNLGSLLDGVDCVDMGDQLLGGAHGTCIVAFRRFTIVPCGDHHDQGHVDSKTGAKLEHGTSAGSSAISFCSDMFRRRRGIGVELQKRL